MMHQLFASVTGLYLGHVTLRKSYDKNKYQKEMSHALHRLFKYLGI